MLIPVYRDKRVAAHFIVSSCDGWAADHRWHLSAGYPAIGGKSVRFHTIAMHPPPGLEVDHIDGDKLNNRRSNLRVVTHAQNVQNVRTKRDLPRGVYTAANGKFYAQVKHRGKKHCLGHFDTLEEASHAAELKRLALGFLAA